MSSSAEDRRVLEKEKKSLWVMASVFAVLAIVVSAGMLFYNPYLVKTGTTKEVTTLAGADDKGNDPYTLLRKDTIQGLEKSQQTEALSNYIITYDDEKESIDFAPTPSPSELEILPVVEPKSPVAQTPSTAAPVVEPKVTPKPKAPAKKTTQKPAPSVAPKPTSPKTVNTIQYWIQVGSYSKSFHAKEVEAKLKARGIDSIIVTKNVNDNIYYRVRIGSFHTQSEAGVFLKRINSIPDYSESFIIKTNASVKVASIE